MRIRSEHGTHQVFPSVVEAIGNTPVVELSHIKRELPGRIVAKLDYLNPGFSKKDRIARELVETARAEGELRPGQTVVELTSGNTGTGLAIVCAVLGHPFVAVMSAGNSPERARMMRALGAEVVLVPQAHGSVPGQVTGTDISLVEERAQELTAQREAFRADQFVRLANRLAHQRHTGPELWEQTSGEIDAFCDFVGTGGTYAGVTLALKSRRPDIGCYIVEPEEAAVLSGEPVSNEHHRIQGGGYAVEELALLRDVPVDGYVTVNDDQAISVARELALLEGVFAGFSSGAVVGRRYQAARNQLCRRNGGSGACRFWSQVFEHRPVARVAISAWYGSADDQRSTLRPSPSSSDSISLRVVIT